MKPIITEKLYSFDHKIDFAMRRIIYHHPNAGYLGGWFFSLIRTSEIGCVEGLKFIENIALSAINLIGCFFSEKARKDIKVTLVNVKSSAVRIIVLPIGLIYFFVNYTCQPREDANLAKEYKWKDLHFAAAYEDTKRLSQIIQNGEDLNKLTEKIRFTTYFEQLCTLLLIIIALNPLNF